MQKLSEYTVYFCNMGLELFHCYNHDNHAVMYPVSDFLQTLQHSVNVMLNGSTASKFVYNLGTTFIHSVSLHKVLFPLSTSIVILGNGQIGRTREET